MDDHEMSKPEGSCGSAEMLRISIGGLSQGDADTPCFTRTPEAEGVACAACCRRVTRPLRRSPFGLSSWAGFLPTAMCMAVTTHYVLDSNSASTRWAICVPHGPPEYPGQCIRSHISACCAPVYRVHVFMSSIYIYVCVHVCVYVCMYVCYCVSNRKTAAEALRPARLMLTSEG